MPLLLPILAAGFFETNYILTELIVMPLLALLLAGSIASDTTMQRIETRHQDFWGKPLGKSCTDVPVPQEPSSPKEILGTFAVMAVIYIVLRLTCLSDCFSAIFQLIGGLIDTFLK